MKFTELGLMPEILEALDLQGYTSPTPIQEKSIPFALGGRDILGCAQTGTGKTAAFSIPILQQLSKHSKNIKGKRQPSALILTPTRELAAQIGECIDNYSKQLPLKHEVIFGGVSQVPQVQRLKKGTDILVATPGRLLDLIDQGIIDLKFIRHFVLDEADRMLDMGFIHDMRKVMKLLPKKKQTLFFSATMPKTISELAGGILRNPEFVKVDPVSSAAETIRQEVYHVLKPDKKHLLKHLLKDEKMDSVLVFTRTKRGADRLARILSKAKIESAAIHGDKSQGAREKALKGFKSGHLRVLVATDIAARGIDIDSLAFVVNFDIPNESETYVHRIGRTGRAGASGLSISLCDVDEKDYVRDIEKLIGKKIEVITDHPFPITKEGIDNYRDMQQNYTSMNQTRKKRQQQRRKANGGKKMYRK